MGLTANEIATREQDILEREERRQQREDNEGILAQKDDDNGILEQGKDDEETIIIYRKPQPSPLPPPPTLPRPIQQLAIRTPERPRLRRSPSPEASSDVLGLPTSTAPELGAKRKRKHTNKYNEGVREGQLKALQHGKIGRH